jgi:hypothetical protein
MDDSRKDINDKVEKKKLPAKETGGPKGLEPTRYGAETPEWEVKGRVSDF